MAAATPSPWPAGSRLWQALGCLAVTRPQVEFLRPTPPPRGQERPLEPPRTQQALHERRWRMEQVNRSVQRGRLVKDRRRLWQEGVRDRVMELCGALQNFRVRLTPWQPTI